MRASGWACAVLRSARAGRSTTASAPSRSGRRRPVEPIGAYASRSTRRSASSLGRRPRPRGLILRQGTVGGYSRRMRYDLVVNTFVKDALLKKQLFLHDGGLMWRPLVDVQDVATAHIVSMDAPRRRWPDACSTSCRTTTRCGSWRHRRRCRRANRRPHRDHVGPGDGPQARLPCIQRQAHRGHRLHAKAHGARLSPE